VHLHEFLARLHRTVQPRTYLEVGVATGESMALSRAVSIGIDPAFEISHELDTDVRLVRATSDDYFAVNNPTERFGGAPIDLAFIDGMHWAEFALRDFIYVESYTAATSVIVFDDVLPRNVPEAARDRHTLAWTGDVFKVTRALRRLRPDLVVLEVDTQPTGTLVVLLPDARSSVLVDKYAGLEASMRGATDPQAVPERALRRTEAVVAERLLDCSWWSTLVAERAGQVAGGSLAAELATQDWTALREGADSDRSGVPLPA
jgi:predicted O-methyltransferase YrrM